MNETEIGKIPFDRKGVVLVVGFIFFLCAGMLGGYLIKSSEPNGDCFTESAKTETTKTEVALGDTTAKKVTDVADIKYKTFSVPENYFTFEYPDTWTYEKRVNSPGETYAETDWIFYADKNKRQQTIDLHYPMYETAHDGCLKFGDITDYKIEHIATNDSGTFIYYTSCNMPGVDDIYWKKGSIDPQDGMSLQTQEGSDARIMWTDSVSSDIASHIAHSVKVVK